MFRYLLANLSSPLQVHFVFSTFSYSFSSLLQRRPVVLTLDSKLLASGNIYMTQVA